MSLIFALKALGVALNTAVMAPVVVLAAVFDVRRVYEVSPVWAWTGAFLS